MEIQQQLQQNGRLFFKLVAIGFLTAVSLVASFSILALVMDRSDRADKAIAEIASTWGRAQTLQGPIITIPVRRTTTTSTGQQTAYEDVIFLLPNTLTYNTSLETETRSRGIFDAVVYTSHIQGTGTFTTNDIDMSHVEGIVQWNNAKLSIGIPDTRGIESPTALTWDNQQSAFEPGVPTVILESSGMSAPIHIQQNKADHTFSFELTLRGSQNINFIPLGRTTDVSLSSSWPSPSFTGEFLPKERNLTTSGFTAHWSISSFGRSLPQSWVAAPTAVNQQVQENMRASLFGVSLHQEVDFYTQVNRAVKYSVLFIILTFLAFFMFEILSHLRIHPLSYLLIGLAIALFYLLLLSLAEQVGFLTAYGISTIAITGLITGYARSILKAKKKAGIIAALLIALYAYLYILLQLDELSLIFGSLFLFGILATIMYMTRNVDWYTISEN